jgi:hypothetical protein
MSLVLIYNVNVIHATKIPARNPQRSPLFRAITNKKSPCILRDFSKMAIAKRFSAVRVLQSGKGEKSPFQPLFFSHFQGHKLLKMRTLRAPKTNRQLKKIIKIFSINYRASDKATAIFKFLD